jgi:hypothetical protein
MFQPISPIDLSSFTNSNIRSRLITALGSELGEYQPGLPAIYFVSNPDTDPPKTYRTNGLECLIFDPHPQSPKTLHHNAALVETWEIRLIQHDRSRSVLDAYKSILSAYPDTYLDSHIPANRDTDEQLNLSISQVGVIK